MMGRTEIRNPEPCLQDCTLPAASYCTFRESFPSFFSYLLSVAARLHPGLSSGSS